MTSSTVDARKARRGAAAQRAGETLLRLGMRMYRLEVETLESVSVPLSVRQFRILDRVDRQITSMTQLAALAQRQLPTISRSVDSLVRQGLLLRQPSTTDRRVTALELTPEGKEILDEARRSLAQLATWVGEVFDLELDAAQLAATVDRLYAATQGQLHPERGTTGRDAR